ncbi:MAG: pyridoxal phosphate-dependent aminotransferase [Caulobacteraceae bacterium]|nr:pyridoxal phosphate-dependent aminotransferase [Caulobacteraceae bacterium]
MADDARFNPMILDMPMARLRAQALGASKIREVANRGYGVQGLRRFWVGESDEVTPPFIRDAAMRALEAGRTFYTHNRGTAELRGALGAYLSRLHGQTFDPDRLSITSAGIQALMIVMQAILDPGDRVVAVTPVWPNCTEAPQILGADVVRVGIDRRDGRWTLDLDKLIEAITPDTRLVLLNSPNNPSGWTLAPDQRQPLLDHCRRLGVWLISDDVYERLTFGTDRAPSFLPLADPQDRLVSTNSFSKAWRMTGWRLGWMVAPASLEADLAKLLEYNTSCAPDFVQSAAIAALEQGEPFIAQVREGLVARRARLMAGLSALSGVEATAPDGGMYVMLRVEGETDSLDLAKRLIDEAALGLAPGSAFGPEGEGWLRWCFAVSEPALDEGVERLGKWLRRR